MKFRICAGLYALLISCSFGVSAALVSGLYEAELVVADQEAAALRTAARRGLKDVLVVLIQAGGTGLARAFSSLDVVVLDSASTVPAAASSSMQTNGFISVRLF